MKINWTVRLKNKTFWLTAIPALLLLGSQILALFGVSWTTLLWHSSCLPSPAPCSACWPFWAWLTTPPQPAFPTAARR